VRPVIEDMPYTHFRYIAYEVPTATIDTVAANSAVESGFVPGNACPAVARLPVPGGLPADANVRLRRLAAVIDRAATRLQAAGGDNDTTLKIFMAPEFYFRPPAGTGANYRSDTYPQADMFKIWDAFDTMFQHADFTHWLFVPGTVMWNNGDDEMFKAKPNYFNSLLHIRGGDRQHPTQRVEKQLPSGIDGIPCPYAPGRDPKVKPIYEDWRNRRARVFSVDSTYLGLEVCLDHATSANCRVLKTVLSQWNKNEGADRDVSLHLLTAGGMPIEGDSVAARVGGYVLRNDGYANAPRSELRKVEGYKSKIVNVSPSDLRGTAELGAAIGGADVSAIPAGDERVPMKGGNYFEFAQRILIYPAQALP
jgi:hypothetical protein